MLKVYFIERSKERDHVFLGILHTANKFLRSNEKKMAYIDKVGYDKFTKL